MHLVHMLSILTEKLSPFMILSTHFLVLSSQLIGLCLGLSILFLLALTTAAVSTFSATASNVVDLEDASLQVFAQAME